MRRPDLGAIVAGLVFAALGVIAIVLGASAFASALKWLWPLVLIGLGVALLATRPQASSNGNGRRHSAGKHRPGHQVGSERSEDG